MSGKFNMDDYVDVSERIRQFNGKYPEGSLQSEVEFVNGGVLCKAFAYRTATDERPGIGHAFEPIPGKTPYTKDSETMNAETSAWGRAIVALGFETKKIASANEVRARQSAGEPSAQQPASEPDAGTDERPKASSSPAESPADKARMAQEARAAKPASGTQIAKIDALIGKAAGARKTTEEAARTAIVNDYGPIADLTQDKATELEGKLTRWAAATT
jgi:hypothetical protein